MNCTFIHMGLERGPVVQGFIRVDGKAELMRFVARNIRAISPLRWDLNLGLFFFRPTPSWLPPARYTHSIAANS